MFLKSIELQGFKSFPDKTQLNFHKGITAVVGPNGSGKSNVSDAVRWVLGEQSSKSLRGSKMEDVIFSGTDSRKAQGFAQVTLVLDNSDRQLEFDNDEVSVTRRYYRSGESEYILGGATVRLRDIHELFMDTGLGRDGYSIISQGKIADIISSKSEERREIFEEAAGISKYRYRRRDAQRKLAQAEENMVRLLDILNELESRVGPLKTQSEKAEKFLSLADEKKKLEIGLWLDLISKSNDRLREQEKKITIATAQYEECEKAIDEIEKENEQIYNSTAQSNLVIEAIRQNVSAFEEEALRKDGEIGLLEQEILHNDETIARIKEEASKAGENKELIEAQIAERKALIEQLKGKIEAKRQELELRSKSMQELMNENAASTQKIAEQSTKISKLSLELSDMKVEKSTALNSADEIRSRSLNIDEMLDSRESALKHNEKEKAECEAQLEVYRNKVKELENSLEGYRLRMITRKEKAAKLQAECDKLNSESYNKIQRLAMLEELQKNMEGYSGAVKNVIKESKHKVLTGINGALADLIKVDKEYSVAIETALGNAIQNVVTDTEKDAKRAINYLKSHNLGRVTFLPISAIKERSIKEKGVEACAGFVGFAPELVECDKMYREIIGNLLGKTIIAEDLDYAIEIAKKYAYAFKIVTLDGQVINAGGSMTGGSKAKNVGVLSRANEIDALRKESQKLKQQAEKAYSEAKAAKADLAKTEADVDALKADIISAGEDIIRQQGELRLVEEQYNSAKQAVEELLNEKQNAGARIDSLMQQANSADEKIKTIEAKISECEKALEAVNVDKEEISKRREKLNEAAGAINIEIVEAQKDISSNRDNIQALTLQMLSQQERAGKINEEVAEINLKSEKCRGDINLIKEKAAELRQKAEQAKAEIERIISDRSEYEKRSTELRAMEKEQTSKREKLSGEIARLSERKINMQNEYETTVNKLYDEYELSQTEAEALDIVIENVQEAQRNLNSIKAKIRALGSVNVSAIEEYREVKERYDFLKLQLEDVEKSQRELNKLIKELTNKMSAQFTESFAKINKEFGATMREFFDGGKAELVLEDENDVLECGIEIKVQPPGKNVQNIALLSGGEKSLAAVALLFAILKVTPAPFCIYDEVEAALDDVNVDRYAKYMRKMCGAIQFIAITHRRGTMEEADVLYGVTMQEKGVSKLLELKTAEVAEKLGI